MSSDDPTATSPGDRPRKPWVKFCGLTNAEDTRQAILTGCDLIGLNFYSESPRAISFGRAQQLVAVVERHQPRKAKKKRRKVRTVAVFVNPEDELVEGVLEHVRPDILQFHMAFQYNLLVPAMKRQQAQL